MTVCIGAPTPPRHADAPRAGHRKARPAPALAPLVEHYWVTRWDRRGHPPRVATALLEPCVHLQLRDGRLELMGVVRGTYRTVLVGSGCVVGVRFRPGGFHPFVRRPVAQWTDRTVAAEDALGVPRERVEALAHALAVAADARGDDLDGQAAAAAAQLDAFLLALAPAPDVRAAEMARFVAALAARPHLQRVRELAAASGCSERTLHRHFLRWIGASPAWVARRYRLLAATERLAARPPVAVQALAYEFGFADQAHFIREFRAAVGVTPGAYASARA